MMVDARMDGEIMADDHVPPQIVNLALMMRRLRMPDTYGRNDWPSSTLLPNDWRDGRDGRSVAKLPSRPSVAAQRQQQGLPSPAFCLAV